MDQQEETKEQQKQALSAWVLAILGICIIGIVILSPPSLSLILPDLHSSVKSLASISLLVFLGAFSGFFILLFKLPFPDISVPSFIAKLAAARNGESPVELTNTKKMNDAKVDVIIHPNSIFPFNAYLTDPEEFYGRASERALLLSRIHLGASTSIIGPRRIGKTWLAEYMRLVAPTELGPRFQIGYLNVALPSCKTVEGFITKALEALGITTSEFRDVVDLAVLEKVVTDLIARKKTPVLCLDEFEAFRRSQEFDANFFSELRAIATLGLVLVTCSKAQLSDIIPFNEDKTSPFVNIFQQIKLGPFNSRDARAFVQAKAEQVRLTEQEQAFLLHYARTDRQEWPPVRLQLVGTTLIIDKLKVAYHPDNTAYCAEFKHRIEKQYQAIMD